MAKGQEEKDLVIRKIMEVFPDAFEYEKALRIPINDVQIKVQLTCAKENVEAGSDCAVPGAAAPTKPASSPKLSSAIPAGDFEFGETKIVEPSQSELNAVSDLMSALGL